MNYISQEKEQFLMLSISTNKTSIMTGNSDLQNDIRGIDLFQDCILSLFSLTYAIANMTNYIKIKRNIKIYR